MLNLARSLRTAKYSSLLLLALACGGTSGTADRDQIGYAGDGDRDSGSGDGDSGDGDNGALSSGGSGGGSVAAGGTGTGATGTGATGVGTGGSGEGTPNGYYDGDRGKATCGRRAVAWAPA